MRVAGRPGDGVRWKPGPWFGLLGLDPHPWDAGGEGPASGNLAVVADCPILGTPAPQPVRVYPGSVASFVFLFFGIFFCGAAGGCRCSCGEIPYPWSERPVSLLTFRLPSASWLLQASGFFPHEVLSA